MKEEEIKKLCRLEFENIIKKLKKNVDRNIVECQEKWRLGDKEDFDAVFMDAIELKFAAGLHIGKREAEKNNTKKAIKNLFKAKLWQVCLSYADILENEANKFTEYANKKMTKTK